MHEKRDFSFFFVRNCETIEWVEVDKQRNQPFGIHTKQYREVKIISKTIKKNYFILTASDKEGKNEWNPIKAWQALKT